MRGPGVLALMAAMVIAACGGGGACAPSSTAPVTSSSTPATEPAAGTTTTVAPTPSDPSTSSTLAPPVEQPVTTLPLLRPDGLGSVDFGTPADDAISELSSVFGPPDRIDAIAPIGPGGDGCVEGAGWLDCLRDLRLIDAGRLAFWHDEGLEVAFVDTGLTCSSADRTELQFGDWHATVATGDVRPTTAEGVFAGMSTGALKLAVPRLEFTYNEGLLDSYYIQLPDGGGYWGRLDWDPMTADIEWGDVRAVQAALNEHGADLAVDGQWGPRTEAAWLAFLADHGIEVFTSQPWLTPEIGAALGLPPDDIIVATVEPRPACTTASTEPTTSTETTSPTALTGPPLRSDGLGRFDFGAPANELVPELQAVLGPPTDDISQTPDGPGPFEYLPGGYWAAYELRGVVWDDPGLQLVLSDIPWLGDRFGEPTPGTLTLVSWATDSNQLRLDSGIGVGSTLTELLALHPQLHVGEYDFSCELDYDPARFRTGTDVGDVPRGWLDVRGELDWDWVFDAQQALNERGASLAVDGTYGPNTRAAVTAFQQAHNLDDGNGLMGPETAEALGLQAPADARVVRLEAGYPGSC